MTKKIATPEEIITEDTTTESKETTKMKLNKIAPKEFTQEQITEMTSEDIQKLILIDFGQNVISKERAIKFLINKVRAGKLSKIPAVAMLSWTNRRVWVQGTANTFKNKDGSIGTISGSGIKEEADAKLNPSQEEYEAYTSEQLADIVNQYIHKDKAADVIIPSLLEKGMPLTPEDLMFITNNRVTIKGLEPKKVTKIMTKKITPIPSEIIDGVSFG